MGTLISRRPPTELNEFHLLFTCVSSVYQSQRVGQVLPSHLAMSNKLRGLWAIQADSLGDSAGYGAPWTTSYGIWLVTGILHRVVCQTNLWESIHPLPLVLANGYTSQHDLDGRVQLLSLVICLCMVWSPSRAILSMLEACAHHICSLLSYLNAAMTRHLVWSRQIQKLVPTVDLRSCHIWSRRYRGVSSEDTRS